MNKPQVGIGQHVVPPRGNSSKHAPARTSPPRFRKASSTRGSSGMRFQHDFGVKADGISMGHDGMSFSLQSRELIARTRSKRIMSGPVVRTRSIALCGPDATKHAGLRLIRDGGV